MFECVELRMVKLTIDSIGNDGPWSSFNIRLGSPPQLLKMLASTSSSEIWAVSTKGCSGHDGKECITDRGQLFNSTTSSTWKSFANESRSALEEDRDLPYHGNGTYGFENVNFLGKMHGSDPQGTTVHNQVVVQMTTKEYYTSMSNLNRKAFLLTEPGFFGLNPKPLPPLGKRPGHISNIRDMKDQGLIPSLSYGYTAGARNSKSITKCKAISNQE
jgi:hypothetical protein